MHKSFVHQKFLNKSILRDIHPYYKDKKIHPLEPQILFILVFWKLLLNTSIRPWCCCAIAPNKSGQESKQNSKKYIRNFSQNRIFLFTYDNFELQFNQISPLLGRESGWEFSSVILTALEYYRLFSHRARKYPYRMWHVRLKTFKNSIRKEAL